MAKLETIIRKDFDTVCSRIKNEILSGSISASLEDESFFTYGDVCCRVYVFERYSYMGGNRLSLSVTIFGKKEGPVQVSAIAAGGSQGMFIKINTLGESSFLDKFQNVIAQLNQ